MDGLTLDRHKIIPQLSWDDLTEDEKKEYPRVYANCEDAVFFRYLGYIYSLDDFMISHDPDWDGYLTDTFFSGIFVKIDETHNLVHCMRYSAA